MRVDESRWPMLAERVRSRRRELGLSIRAASTAAGIARATWDDLETGARQTRQDRWASVERALQWQPGSIAAILEGGEPIIGERAKVPASSLADAVARIRNLPDVDPADKLRMVHDLLAMYEASEEAARSGQR
jgi:transcriptional regulator with XRE-family HTH domain